MHEYTLEDFIQVNAPQYKQGIISHVYEFEISGINDLWVSPFSVNCL